jgi:hypothetical protein
MKRKRSDALVPAYLFLPATSVLFAVGEFVSTTSACGWRPAARTSLRRCWHSPGISSASYGNLSTGAGRRGKVSRPLCRGLRPLYLASGCRFGTARLSRHSQPHKSGWRRPSEFARNPARLASFYCEPRTLACLNVFQALDCRKQRLTIRPRSRGEIAMRTDCTVARGRTKCPAFGADRSGRLAAMEQAPQKIDQWPWAKEEGAKVATPGGGAGEADCRWPALPVGWKNIPLTVYFITDTMSDMWVNPPRILAKRKSWAR